MKILITGSSGFIGKNLVSQISIRKNFEIIKCDRESTRDDLRKAISEANFVCHMAGVNRPSDAADFSRVNTGLTKALCEEAQK